MEVAVGITKVSDDTAAFNAVGVAGDVRARGVEGGVGLVAHVVKKAVVVALAILIIPDDVAAGNAVGRGGIVRVGIVERGEGLIAEVVEKAVGVVEGIHIISDDVAAIRCRWQRCLGRRRCRRRGRRTWYRFGWPRHRESRA